MLPSFELMRGLGDCLIAGASLQKLGRPVDYITSPLIVPLLANHPTIRAFSSGKAANKFRWVSHIKDRNLYGLHTMQRFSSQIGLCIDPTEVLTIYGSDRKPLVHNSQDCGNYIVVNQYSAEGERRAIPTTYVNKIVGRATDIGVPITFIGKNGPPHNSNEITDISKMVEVLLNCKLFIGPVSFCYHLASCLGVPCLLFTSYMPAHKFSHFFNTVAIESRASCTFRCEEKRASCGSSCEAYSYDGEYVDFLLDKLL